ncbi:aldehyde dehydrogenase family protein [Streptomyces chromofuscus]|uniref:Aldehyde dehydrogenase family protein n=1 Tax=Streptomyces chromofuscus TaxID=42881 RepID=A0A7M2T9E8_STRCW|nr:aldehyde dehydrogenase family protein [Streptomyces chromofuscus]QOV45172.1 aldehyde dehydrogenase family protein [Streptomyces chromofuscus]GGT33470.1 aldehyde dehydrogenase [Streptomyces chromofuscus]
MPRGERCSLGRMNENPEVPFPTPSHWIDGRAVPGSGPLIDVVNPADESVIAAVREGTAEDLDTAVEAAVAAFPGWASTSPQQRADVMRRLAEGLQKHSEELAATITQEMGAPIAFSRQAQVGFPVASTLAAIAAAEQFEWTEVVENSLVIREPIGVVGAITPWNFPLQQLVTKVVPAMLAGNTVVLKPSELSPLSARMFAEIATEAGLPNGVFNVVQGTGQVVGEALSRHPKIDMISFTGSTRAGRSVSVAASGTIKRVALELGGKAAHIVLPEADLDSAVARGLAFAWANGGQACGAYVRMLVPEGLQETVVEKLRAAAEEYVVGDPADEATRIGPLASETQRRRVDDYIRRGIADGATLVVGGPGRPEGFETGAYVKPTIFSDVDPESVIAQEEIFGPVLVVIPYVDDDHAVEIANGTIYGLNAAVTGDEHHAVAIARRLRVGQVDVNGGQHNFQAPFGGYKQSGNGREMGRAGLEEFLETKAITR